MNNIKVKATFLLKRVGKNSSDYSYCINSPDNRELFEFLSRILSNSPHEISKWTLDESLATATNDDDVFKVQIIVYPLNDIINKNLPQGINSYGQDVFIDSNTKTPIIHIDLSGILSGNKKLHLSVPRYYQIIDSSIWNHYVPMVKFDESKNGFYHLFTKAADEIYNNYQCGLYDTEVAKEFADVNARVLQQSYLSGTHATGVAPFIFHSETTIKGLIDKEFNGLKARKKKVKDGEEEKDWPWRFRLLLVDDRAIEKENGFVKKNCKLSIIMRLIEKTLKFPKEKNWIQYRLFEQNEEGELKESESRGCIDDKTKIVIDCVQKYDDAVLALKAKKYDIILLDYLLDLKDGQRKYGYELLEEIKHYVIVKEQFERFCYRNDYLSNAEKANALKDLISKRIDPQETENHELLSFLDDIGITEDRITKDDIEKSLDNIQREIQNNEFKIGSNRKLFFVFISAYSTAVNERLLAQGLNRSEHYWHINTGACPTNTPQLFIYNLLHMMNKRIDGCGIYRLSADKILERVAKIFKPNNKTDKMKDSVRKKASINYDKVLSLQYHFRRMTDDLEIPYNYNQTPQAIFNIKGSVLISHYCFKNQHLSGLLEHLTNLVHIAAFGTIRQWDEMWEEYLYFKAQFKEVIRKDNIMNSKDGQITDIFQNECEHIESFILELKSQQQ